MKDYKNKWSAISSDIEKMSEEIGKIRTGREDGDLKSIPLLLGMIVFATLIGLTIWLV